MKKKIIVSLVLASSLALSVSACGMAAKSGGQPALQTASVQKGDLIRSVLASGIVESAASSFVYSKVQNYAIRDVSVGVGDAVKAGDVLARLDTSALELEIQQTLLNIENAEAALKAETDANAYNETTAANNVESARLDRNERRDDYETIREAHEDGKSTDAKLAQAKTARDKAQLAYDNARANLAFIQSKTAGSAANNIEIQQTMLARQQQTLADATLLAPQDGIVSLVSARENTPANGLLFVIEDTADLVIATAIGEYDIHSVQTGQDVIVKADGAANREYLGRISSIAPTAAKDGEGRSASSSNVQFATEVTLADPDESIRIGMNVQLSIKLEEKTDTFYIPYDALTAEADGSYSIQVVDESQTSGKEAVLRRIPVEKGMETDLYTEILSPELTEGLSVRTGTAQAAQ